MPGGGAGFSVVGAGRGRNRRNEAKQEAGFSVTKAATVLLFFKL